MELEQYRPLLLKTNRALGAALLEAKLITPEQLEAANVRLLEQIKHSQWRQAALLPLLLSGNGELKEGALLQYQAEIHGVGLIVLSSYNLERSVEPSIELPVCWMTRSLPYDRQEEFVFIATNNYLSEPVREYWAQRYSGLKIVWMAAGVGDLSEAIERVESRGKK
jgi:hypothetical protein